MDIKWRNFQKDKRVILIFTADFYDQKVKAYA